MFGSHMFIFANAYEDFTAIYKHFTFDRHICSLHHEKILVMKLAYISGLYIYFKLSPSSTTFTLQQIL